MYVQRDANGVITGVFANPQPQADGSCLTEKKPLPDDDPEIMAFLSRKPIQAMSADELAALLVKQNVIAQSVVDAASEGTAQII